MFLGPTAALRPMAVVQEENWRNLDTKTLQMKLCQLQFEAKEKVVFENFKNIST